MAVDRSTVVFFDASCLVAAAGSPSGGSGYLMLWCSQRKLRAAVSHPVLVEAARNVRKITKPNPRAEYRRLLRTTPLIVVLKTSEEVRQEYRPIVGEKDDHVLAAAVEIGAHYLITLDKRLAASIQAAQLGIKALSPGEFIQQVLPGHPDYASMRE